MSKNNSDEQLRLPSTGEKAVLGVRSMPHHLPADLTIAVKEPLAPSSLTPEALAAWDEHVRQIVREELAVALQLDPADIEQRFAEARDRIREGARRRTGPSSDTPPAGRHRDFLMTALLLLLAGLDVPSPPAGDAVRAVWLADLHPDRIPSGIAGHFVFVPDSLPDEHDGHVLVEAAGPPGVLRTGSFAKGETDEGLDVAAPLVVEGVLVVIRHPARGEFRAVIELQVREARRVW